MATCCLPTINFNPVGLAGNSMVSHWHYTTKGNPSWRSSERLTIETIKNSFAASSLIL